MSRSLLTRARCALGWPLGRRELDLRLPVFLALHWTSRRRTFKSAMGALASVTGVHHEMHMTCTKV